MIPHCRHDLLRRRQRIQLSSELYHPVLDIVGAMLRRPLSILDVAVMSLQVVLFQRLCCHVDAVHLVHDRKMSRKSISLLI